MRQCSSGKEVAEPSSTVTLGSSPPAPGAQAVLPPRRMQEARAVQGL